MSFTDLPFPYGPFVPHPVCKQYIESYFSWQQLNSNLVLNTAVENVRRLKGDRWQLTLRRHDVALQVDDWWQETFDALIVAGGHYSVPFVSASILHDSRTVEVQKLTTSLDPTCQRLVRIYVCLPGSRRALEDLPDSSSIQKPTSAYYWQFGFRARRCNDSPAVRPNQISRIHFQT